MPDTIPVFSLCKLIQSLDSPGKQNYPILQTWKLSHREEQEIPASYE
jgi:hypothetical protein